MKKWVRNKHGCIVGLTEGQKAVMHAVVALNDKPAEPVKKYGNPSTTHMTTCTTRWRTA